MIEWVQVQELDSSEEEDVFMITIKELQRRGVDFGEQDPYVAAESGIGDLLVFSPDHVTDSLSAAEDLGARIDVIEKHIIESLELHDARWTIPSCA